MSFVKRLIACLSACFLYLNPAYSSVNSDETVIFFNTSAWLNIETQQWHIPIHGWIYEPVNSTFRKAALAEILKKKYGLVTNDSNKEIFARRANLLFSDNERNEKIVIKLLDQEYTLTKSEANGHFYGEVQLPVSDTLPNIISYTVKLREKDKRVFQGWSQLVEPKGLSVISDIDDTVKLSYVTDRKRLMQSTFFEPFKPVEGMAERYRELLFQHRASFYFVSSSPWQLYPELLNFSNLSAFPWASFSLKYIRFKDSTIMNLFKPGIETKPIQIQAIMDRYPERAFILIGDSGENDPEVYSQIAERYPEQVKAIFIRNVSGESVDDERYQTLFSKLPIHWQLFEKPEEMDFSTLKKEY